MITGLGAGTAQARYRGGYYGGGYHGSVGYYGHGYRGGYYYGGRGAFVGGLVGGLVLGTLGALAAYPDYPAVTYAPAPVVVYPQYGYGYPAPYRPYYYRPY
ncbi:MAG: hypothetical protein HQK60_10545 [Deltaproteobacteria bacterium]|nr:hypothetical protein [Deltaproteobacteria bacterium]